jgi:hypothetical protein
MRLDLARCRGPRLVSSQHHPPLKVLCRVLVVPTLAILQVCCVRGCWVLRAGRGAEAARISQHLDPSRKLDGSARINGRQRRRFAGTQLQSTRPLHPGRSPRPVRSTRHPRTLGALDRHSKPTIARSTQRPRTLGALGGQSKLTGTRKPARLDQSRSHAGTRKAPSQTTQPPPYPDSSR